jgi:hypothetical protein
MSRRLLCLVTIATVGVVLLTAATTADAKPRSRAIVNQAVAVDSTAGRATHRLVWMVRDNVGGALPSNYAKAQTWCNDCHSTAIAVQIVLMSNVVGPTAAWNHSVAANSRCARCSTVAAAFQFAVISSERVTLTPSGAAQLGVLRDQMSQIASANAAPTDVNAAAVAVATRILGVLKRELRTDADPGAALRLMATGPEFQIRFQRDVEIG